MAIEDKLQPPPLSRKQLPPFSPEDEKKAQKELARLRRNKKRGFEGKTLWDWLQLLGVPIFLAFATIGFGLVQISLADETIPERGQTGRLLKRVSVPVYFCMAVLHLPSERFAPILEWSPITTCPSAALTLVVCAGQV